VGFGARLDAGSGAWVEVEVAPAGSQARVEADAGRLRGGVEAVAGGLWGAGPVGDHHQAGTADPVEELAHQLATLLLGGGARTHACLELESVAPRLDSSPASPNSRRQSSIRFDSSPDAARSSLCPSRRRYSDAGSWNHRSICRSATRKLKLTEPCMPLAAAVLASYACALSVGY
jgi:hypothetical protein